jgi:3',5'-cyclic AMP phosphodiesterase CpdA
VDFFFIQMSDPQFGMFSRLSGMDDERIQHFRQVNGWNILSVPKSTGFAQESALYEKAIAAANRLNPAFVVISGDMVEDRSDPGQLAELRRISALLNPHIPVHWAPGNWDVGNTPTPETLAQYRENFGDDYYAFQHADSSFIVLNTSVGFDDSQTPGEWDRQMAFLDKSLIEARNRSSAHIVVILHHPLFLQDPNEEDSWGAMPQGKRRMMLELFDGHPVSAVFSGHLHKCHQVNYKGIQMVTTGAVGYPLGPEPSGFRIVNVSGDKIEHKYYGLDQIPEPEELRLKLNQ